MVENSPGFMFLGFEPRSLLDNVVSRPFSAAGAPPRRHSAGEPVWCKNYGAGASWRPAVVQTTRGARLSTVKTEYGELCERHEDQLRHRSDGHAPISSDGEGAEVKVSAPTTVNSEPLVSSAGSTPIPAQIAEHETGPINTGVPENHDPSAGNAGPPANTVRRSTRRRKAPDRL
ncbi:hypothetical protein MTO96_006581 [Rhipicephalus appendiculatus]